MHGVSGSYYDINLSKMSAWGLEFKHVSQPKMVTGIFQPEIFLCIGDSSTILPPCFNALFYKKKTTTFPQVLST